MIPNITYNGLSRWRYTGLLHVLGCDSWFVARVTAGGRFEQAAVLQRRGLSTGEGYRDLGA